MTGSSFLQPLHLWHQPIIVRLPESASLKLKKAHNPILSNYLELRLCWIHCEHPHPTRINLHHELLIGRWRGLRLRRYYPRVKEVSSSWLLWTGGCRGVKGELTCRDKKVWWGKRRWRPWPTSVCAILSEFRRLRFRFFDACCFCQLKPTFLNLLSIKTIHYKSCAEINLCTTRWLRRRRKSTRRQAGG